MEPTQTLFLVVMKVGMASLYIYILEFISVLGPESCGIIPPPLVMSISYGQDEATVTPKFANRQCTEYAKVDSRCSLSCFSLTLILISSACWEPQCYTVVVILAWLEMAAYV